MKKLLLVLLLATLPAFAGNVPSGTFAFTPTPDVFVPLGAGLDPLLTPEFGTLNYLDFGTDYTANDHALASIEVPGFEGFQAFTTECEAVCTEIYGWSVPGSYQPIAGTLTVTLSGISQTYDFQYQDPVPEPSSLVLLSCGLGGIALWRYLG